MSDDLLFFFEFDDLTPSPLPQGPFTPVLRDTLPTYVKPKDDFSTLILIPGTVFYLTITTPHTDSWTHHGPVSTFAALIPLIEKAISSFPSAVLKWQKLVKSKGEEDQEEDWDVDVWGNLVLQEKGPTFKERGFCTFVFEYEKDGYEVEGDYAVMSVVREINGNVLSLLPAPVFTLTSHGPLHHDMGTSLHTIHSGRPKGVATTSKVIRSYTTAAEAQTAAHRIMDYMVKDEKDVRRTEVWEGLGTGKEKHLREKKGVGRGLLMGMNAQKMWEVKVEYESDVLADAVGRFDGEGRNAERGKKATWRV